MFRTLKHHTLGLGALLLSGICFTGCFASAEDPLSASSDPAQVSLSIPVAASATAPKQLVVVLASSKGDTLRDTITEDGSRLSSRYAVLAGSANHERSVHPRYTLPSNRSWKVTARILDARDSLKDSGSCSIAHLRAYEQRETPVTMAGRRFTVYGAEFVLPAELSLTGAAGSRVRQVYFTRLQLAVDGKVVIDSAAAGLRGDYLSVSESRLTGALGLRFFRAFAQTGVTLSHEYMLPGARRVELSAYGYLEGDTVGVTPPRLLFQGGKTVGAALAKASGVEGDAVTLEWMDADSALDADNVGLTVKLGKVGKVVVIAQASGALEF